MTKHLNIQISGRVQGVFFRQSAKEQAEKFNISGFAKNLSDGSIFIEAEGKEQNLKAFINWCHRGPEYAQVDDIKINQQDRIKNYSDFVIY